MVRNAGKRKGMQFVPKKKAVAEFQGEKMEFANNSGDHNKSIKLNVPILNEDIVNKVYVDGNFLKLDGTNTPSADYSWTTDLTTTGKGTFGELDVDTLNFSNNVISDSTGVVSFDDDDIETTGKFHINNAGTSRMIDIKVFADSGNYTPTTNVAGEFRYKRESNELIANTFNIIKLTNSADNGTRNQVYNIGLSGISASNHATRIFQQLRNEAGAMIEVTRAVPKNGTSASTDVRFGINNNGTDPIFTLDVAGDGRFTEHLHIKDDHKSVFFGAGDDADIRFVSDSLTIRSNLVTTSNALNFQGGTNGIEFNIDATEQMILTDGVFKPTTNNDIDLGTSSNEFKDAFFDGTVETDGLIFSNYLSVTSDDTSTASSSEYNIFDEDNYPSATLNTTDNVTALNISLTKSTGVFDVVEAGIYEIQCNFIVTQSGSASTTYIIKINGTPVYSHPIFTHSVVDPSEATVTIIKSLSAGDDVTFHVDSTTSATVTIEPGTTVNIKRIATT